MGGEEFEQAHEQLQSSGKEVTPSSCVAVNREVISEGGNVTSGLSKATSVKDQPDRVDEAVHNEHIE